MIRCTSSSPVGVFWLRISSVGCVGIVSGGVVGVGYVSLGGVVGVVGFSVACWDAWVSSVLFSDGSGTVGVDGAGSDVAGPDAALSRDSEGSVWADQSSKVSPKWRLGVFTVFLSKSGVVHPTNTRLRIKVIIINLSRGRGISRITTRWYPPAGWSQKAIDRELVKVAVAFEQKVKAGEVITRQEERIESYRRELEAAQIKTLKQYGETVFMPSLAIRCSENTRTGYQGNLNKWIYPVLGDFKLPEVTAAQITALLLSMQAQSKSHSTVIKVYTVLQGLFKMAYLADLIAWTRCSAPDPERTKSKHRKRRLIW